MRKRSFEGESGDEKSSFHVCQRLSVTNCSLSPSHLRIIQCDVIILTSGEEKGALTCFSGKLGWNGPRQAQKQNSGQPLGIAQEKKQLNMLLNPSCTHETTAYSREKTTVFKILFISVVGPVCFVAKRRKS